MIEDQIFISVITLAELRHGIERLAPGVRRDRLDAWLTEEVPQRFETRLLDVDAETANMWGRVMARGQAAGPPRARWTLLSPQSSFAMT